MSSLDQERSAYAWKRAQNCSSDYANLAKSAPALIMNNGLMQTLAFFMAKGGEHKTLNTHIIEWLGVRFKGVGAFPENEKKADFQSVMAALHQSEPAVYRRASEEALALLRWIRQFASAVRAS